MAETYQSPTRVREADAQDWEKTYATFVHLTALTNSVVPVIGALIMWQLKKDESRLIDDHGKEAVNFQISLWIYGVIAGILTMIFIGLFLFPVIFILWLVGMIMGAVAAHKGEYFRYPMTLRLIA